jgi:hypothetical protein
MNDQTRQPYNAVLKFQRPLNGALDRVVHVGVVHHDDGILAAISSEQIAAFGSQRDNLAVRRTSK